MQKLDRFGAQLNFGAREALLRLPNRIGYWSETAAASAMQSDGRLLVAGTGRS